MTEVNTYQVLDISHLGGLNNIIVPLTLTSIQKYGDFNQKAPKKFSFLVKLNSTTTVRYRVVDVKNSENTGDFIILTMVPDKTFLKDHKILNYKTITLRLNIS